MSKTKKPNKSGYAFRGLFAGIDDEANWVTRLKAVAKKEHRSVTAQAKVFIMKGIQNYENSITTKKGDK